MKTTVWIAARRKRGEILTSEELDDGFDWTGGGLDDGVISITPVRRGSDTVTDVDDVLVLDGSALEHLDLDADFLLVIAGDAFHGADVGELHGQLLHLTDASLSDSGGVVFVRKGNG